MTSGAALPAAGSNTAAKTAATIAERIVRPEFTGSATEYFRIWIVNLFFTLITLGIYSAWAKVRKKRYFYGCTRLDGDTFDYFGSPRVILKGRIVAALLFVIYAFSTEIYPLSQIGFLAVLLLALPWLVVRSVTFNARNSAYRGLRFDFTATPRQATSIYIGIPIIVGITAGLTYPWFAARKKTFIVSHHALGTTGFGCDVRLGDFYRIYFIAGLMMIGLAVPTGILAWFMTMKLQLPAWLGWANLVMPMILLYMAYALVYAYVTAHTTNLLWNGAYGPGLRFTSTLEAGKLARLYIGNIMAAAATAGLLIPWGVIRTLRYRLDHFAMSVDGAEIHEANPSLERVGATGQEFGDIFNLELGL